MDFRGVSWYLALSAYIVICKTLLDAFTINIYCLFQLIPVGTTIFDRIRAVDTDAGVNGLAEYFVIPGDNKTIENANAADGYQYFSIPLPHQGQVTVNRSLDYERTQKYLVTIVASVSIYLNYITYWRSASHGRPEVSYRFFFSIDFLLFFLFLTIFSPRQLCAKVQKA